MTTHVVDTKTLNKGGLGFSDGLLSFMRPRAKKSLQPLMAPAVNTTDTAHVPTLEETMRLLKKAQNTIEKAERIISEQTMRIQNLEDINTVDEITGFLNPRGFERAFQRERERLKAQPGRSGLIVLIEMENFDFIQSKFDQNTAENGLKLISRVLRDEIREMDSVGRMKKSEFVLLYTGIGTDVALDRTQKLALRVNSLGLTKGHERIPVSASIRLQDFTADTQFFSLF